MCRSAVGQNAISIITSPTSDPGMVYFPYTDLSSCTQVDDLRFCVEMYFQLWKSGVEVGKAIAGNLGVGGESRRNCHI